jgi:hypothetical protein
MQTLWVKQFDARQFWRESKQALDVNNKNRCDARRSDVRLACQ